MLGAAARSACAGLDCLAVLLRQIGAADSHIDHLDAVTVSFSVELVADPGHQGFALRPATTVMKVTSPSTRAQRRVQERGQLNVGGRDRPDTLIKPQRVLDPVTREGVDHQPL